MQVAALEYHQHNIIVFPVQVSMKEGKAVKMPLVVGWQHTTLDDYKKFDWSKCNAIGMLTGEPNGILVLDLDLGADVSGKEMPPTPCQKTGSGGKHYLYKYIPGVRNSAGKIGAHIDIRGDGGYIVCAPSWHPQGQYEWIVPFDRDMLADAPQWLVDSLHIDKTYKKHDASLAFGAPEGTRNQSCAQVIGHILAHIHPNYWLDFGLGGLREWNKRNNPPLPDDELVATFKSIAARQYARK